MRVLKNRNRTTNDNWKNKKITFQRSTVSNQMWIIRNVEWSNCSSCICQKQQKRNQCHMFDGEHSVWSMLDSERCILRKQAPSKWQNVLLVAAQNTSHNVMIWTQFSSHQAWWWQTHRHLSWPFCWSWGAEYASLWCFLKSRFAILLEKNRRFLVCDDLSINGPLTMHERGFPPCHWSWPWSWRGK